MSPFGLRALSCNATYTSTFETGRVNLGLLESLLRAVLTQFAYNAS